MNLLRRIGDRGWRRYKDAFLWLAVVLIALAVLASLRDSRDAADAARAQAAQNHTFIVQLQHHQDDLDLISRAQAREQSLLVAQQRTIAASAHYLCIRLNRGRAVFKTLLDELGKPRAAEVQLADCATKAPKPKGNP